MSRLFLESEHFIDFNNITVINFPVSIFFSFNKKMNWRRSSPVHDMNNYN